MNEKMMNVGIKLPKSEYTLWKKLAQKEERSLAAEIRVAMNDRIHKIYDTPVVLTKEEMEITTNPPEPDWDEMPERMARINKLAADNDLEDL